MQKSLIPLPREVTQSPSEGVQFSICLSRAVFNLEVVSGEEFGPSGLSAVENLGCYEIFKVFLVPKYLDYPFC